MGIAFVGDKTGKFNVIFREWGTCEDTGCRGHRFSVKSEWNGMKMKWTKEDD